MSQLQARKTELETLRDQWRSHNATHPTTAGAESLRQIESELAQVNTRIVRGPGAKGVISAAIGRVSAQRGPQRATAQPTPAPLPTAAPTVPPRLSFLAENDVPIPTQARSRDGQRLRQNGQPTTPALAAPPDQVPAAVPRAEPPPRRFAFQGADDVAYPTPIAPHAGAAIFRGNGRRNV